jgi:hypothetical protein
MAEAVSGKDISYARRRSYTELPLRDKAKCSVIVNVIIQSEKGEQKAVSQRSPMFWQIILN